MSCQKHRHTKQQAIRKTWLRDLPEHIHAYFYEGGHPEEKIQDDVICLTCGDGYEDLAIKSYSFLKFAHTTLNFDYVCKCDDDTYVHIRRLLNSGFEKHDYTGNLPPGNAWKNGVYAQGGLYILSRKAVKAITDTPFESGRGKRWWWGAGLPVRSDLLEDPGQDYSTEDVMVGDILRENGIYLNIDPRFNHDSSPTPYDSFLKITCHHVSEKEFYLIYNDRNKINKLIKRLLFLEEIRIHYKKCKKYIKNRIKKSLFG